MKTRQQTYPLSNPTPASLGFRMPAEWESHAATWLAWPYNLETWEGHLEGAEEAFSALIAALTPHETVHLLVPNAEVHERAKRKLQQLHLAPSQLNLHVIETGDVWFRDFGPLFITRGKNGAFSSSAPQCGASRSVSRLAPVGLAREKREVAWTKWNYNALGNKWADLLIGDEVPGKMPIQDFPHFEAGIVLEGGSIDVNGRGSLLTTESCLLNPNRNPGLSREKIEGKLRDYLGVSNILWLAGGIEGDDTDGHIDDVTRFVDPSTIVTVMEEDPQDENFAVLRENFQRLKEMKDERGQSFRILPLPMPRPLSCDGRRMAASYANFYIANGVVVVPTYNQSSDEVALQTLQNIFSERRVIGIDCRELIYGYGALHCVTQQQPWIRPPHTLHYS